MLTAAVLTGEVFKHATGLRPEAMRVRQTLDFCPVTLTEDPGVVTETPMIFTDTALVGGGAIGTAISLILRELPSAGRLVVVDPQTFEEPNVTTYSLGNVQDAQNGLRKIDLIKRELHGFDVTTIYGTAQDLLEKIDRGNVWWPKVVLGAVDSISARHELQRVYADLTLDGSTGGHVGTTLALREGLPTGPCLRCYYPLRDAQAGPSAEQLLHQSTGLAMNRIARGQLPLSERDLDGLSETGKRILAPHVGKPVCGLASLLGLVPDSRDDYRPSAAFVAQQAAALVVGALIARQTGTLTGAVRDVEYDALYGPYLHMIASRRPRPACACASNKDLIEQVREVRSSLIPRRGRC
ncbi:hypothetical protein Lesp02_42200 [Lentzea sp. NBRC 105346]|nr:hypothetical protein Lesp02_42200 [Lentzea sp. NBRC 105346]